MVICITGPVASGKSLAASFFRAKGVLVIDADKAGHILLRNNSIKVRLKKIFGDGIFRNREINHRKLPMVDRRKLGDLVFRDKRARKKLDSVMHPAINREIKKRIGHFKGRKVVIHAALMSGLGLAGICDKTILVTAPTGTILERARSRGIPRSKALAILNAQSGQKKYWKKCDYRINNNSTPRNLKKEIIKLHI